MDSEAHANYRDYVLYYIANTECCPVLKPIFDFAHCFGRKVQERCATVNE